VKDNRQRPLDRIYQRLSDRLGDSLEREMIAADSLAPRRTPARTAAVAVAAVVYIANIALLAAGVALLVLAHASPVAVVIGLLCLAVVTVIFPRPYRAPKKDRGDLADHLPELQRLVGDVAARIGVAVPDEVRLDDEFNASWSVEGWRRRRVLRLGVPLLAALNGKQTVALVAHELAHDRNGDARRGLLVGSTVQSLSTALYLLGPEARPFAAATGTAAGGIMSAAAPLTNAVMWVLSRPVHWLLVLQAHLLYRDSQRAEYLADDIAATVAGTAAVVALHDVLLAGPDVVAAVRRAVLTGEHANAELFADVAAAAQDPTQHEDRRRRARKERRRLAATHPPVTSRIAVLEQRRERLEKVFLDPGREGPLRAELSTTFPAHARTLIDRARDGLYRG